MVERSTESLLVSEGTVVDSISDYTTYWSRHGELPPALATGHPLLDFEHRFLISSMANLRAICDQFGVKEDCSLCASECRKSCESELISLLGDVFAFILEHFKSEEAIMRESLLMIVDRDVCQAHMEDHAEIAAAVQEIVASLDPVRVVVRARELDRLLARWLTHHATLHDRLLANWVAREQSLLKGN